MTTRTKVRTTLPLVDVSEKRLEDYLRVVEERVIEEIRSLARDLRGVRVLHLNSSPAGGGVADILEALIPLLRDLGLETEWRVIRGSPSFFDVTKKFHNALQGKPQEITHEMWDIWLKCNEENASQLTPAYDILTIHDPQPAAIRHFLANRNGGHLAKWLWRCHIDLTDAPADLLDKMGPYLRGYDAAEFSMREFIKDGFNYSKVFVVPPGIDPLNPKNVPMKWRDACEHLAGFGVNPNRPIMAQVSRFDPWKDPLGVIDVYRQVKSKIKELQLIMIGPTAADDPEGWSYFEKTARHAGDDPDVHLLSNFKGAGDITVNAVQTRADVMVQRSTREGFGMSVTGSLWHGKPVVARRAGGIALQVIDGETGFIAESPQECAERVLALLTDNALSHKMGEKAREHARRNFLITRYLQDSLVIYRQLLGKI